MIEILIFLLTGCAAFRVINKASHRKREKQRAIWRARTERLKKLDGGIL